MARLADLVPLALLATAACGGPVVASAPAPAATPPSPIGDGEVMVLLVVDQLGAWLLEDRLAGLPADGGLRRLVAEGIAPRRLELRYATTDTALGHATLTTGRWPHESGIVANTTVDDEGDETSFLLDDGARLVTPDGVGTRAASSLARLRVPTLADRLRARRPGARIVSLSLKDRGALFGGGRAPDAVLWYDGREDSFVTSTAFADTFPSFARTHGDRASVAARRQAPWTLLDPAFVRAHTRLADDAAGEGDVGGFGVTFPHDFAASSRPAMAFVASPRGDEALLTLALDALATHASPQTTTLLFVSFSAHDYVGHVFGPESWESLDTLRRLDAQLALLFDALDAQVGPTRWTAMLTADHGASVLPESDLAHAPWCAPGVIDPFERPCAHAVRVDTEAFAEHLEAAADAALGPGDWVLGVASPHVRLTDGARGLDAAARARLDAALLAALRQEPGVVEALSLRDPSVCASPPARLEALCRAVDPSAGDLVFTIADDAFTDSTYVRGFGGGHGAPSAADRLVPLLVRAPGRAALVERTLGEAGTQPMTVYFTLADRLLGGSGDPRR